MGSEPSHAHCVPRLDYDALMSNMNAARHANVNLAGEIVALQTALSEERMAHERTTAELARLSAESKKRSSGLLRRILKRAQAEPEQWEPGMREWYADMWAEIRPYIRLGKEKP